jgi:hypothetical protein
VTPAGPNALLLLVKIVSWLLLSVLACAACNRAPLVTLHAASPPKLEEGWTQLESADGRVSIAIPGSFHSALDRPKAQSFPTSADQPPPAPAPDAQGNLAQPEQNPNPEAKEAVDRFVNALNTVSSSIEERQRKEVLDEMAQKGYVIWAWETGNPTVTEARTAISVKLTKDVGGMSLQGAATKAKEKMPGDVTVEKVSLPIGDAMLVKSKTINGIGDELFDARYVLLDGGDEYIVRFVTSNGSGRIEPIIDPVMQTFRVKPKTP